MNARLRQVRRLRVHAVREDDGRKGRTLVEDALHTASLGDERRLIVVRRLHLGSLSVGAGATAWSRRLEHQMQATRAEAVAAHDPNAASSAVVYFSDVLEPWYQLASLASRGAAPTAWFWRSALPGWNPGLPPPAALALAFQKIAANGLRSTHVLVRRLRSTGDLSALLRVLQARDVAAFFPSVGYMKSAAADRRDAASGDVPEVERLRDFLAQETIAIPPAWTRADPRSWWLTGALLAARDETLVVSLPVLRELAARLVDNIQSGLPADDSRGQRPPTVPESSKPRSGEVYTRKFATAGGGLFFLVPVLRRLIAARGGDFGPPLAWRVLRLALEHARLDEADEFAAALPVSVFPPARGVPWKMLLEADRWVRHRTGLTARELVRRRAEVAISETHVDVFLRLSVADVRIRRAGLDVDPGWVPWLQRVVTFHYGSEGG